MQRIFFIFSCLTLTVQLLSTQSLQSLDTYAYPLGRVHSILPHEIISLVSEYTSEAPVSVELIEPGEQTTLTTRITPLSNRRMVVFRGSKIRVWHVTDNNKAEKDPNGFSPAADGNFQEKDLLDTFLTSLDQTTIIFGKIYSAAFLLPVAPTGTALVEQARLHHWNPQNNSLRKFDQERSLLPIRLLPFGLGRIAHFYPHCLLTAPSIAQKTDTEISFPNRCIDAQTLSDQNIVTAHEDQTQCELAVFDPLNKWTRLAHASVATQIAGITPFRNRQFLTWGFQNQQVKHAIEVWKINKGNIQRTKKIDSDTPVHSALVKGNTCYAHCGSKNTENQKIKLFDLASATQLCEVALTKGISSWTTLSDNTIVVAFDYKSVSYLTEGHFEVATSLSHLKQKEATYRDKQKVLKEINEKSAKIIAGSLFKKIG